MVRDRVIALCMVLACIGFVACAEEAPQEITETGADATEAPAEEMPEEDSDPGAGALNRQECLKVAEGMSGAMGGMGAGPNVDFDQAIEGIRRAGDFAPEEVRDDFDVFADAMAEYLTILQDANIDFNDPASFSTPAAQKAVKKATAVLQAPEVMQAQQNIDRAMTDLCGTG